MISNLSNGNLERKVKNELKARWRQQKAACAYCRRPIDYSAAPNTPWSIEAGHRLSVKTHPHLAYDPGNYIPAHSRCNRQAQDTAYEPVKWTEANWG